MLMCFKDTRIFFADQSERNIFYKLFKKLMIVSQSVTGKFTPELYFWQKSISK
jgi:hypothetical protein